MELGLAIAYISVAKARFRVLTSLSPSLSLALPRLTLRFPLLATIWQKFTSGEPVFPATRRKVRD